MPDMSVTEATQHYGLNRSTLYKYMQKGTISFTTLPNGKRTLNPAEIERVFPGHPKPSATNNITQIDTTNETSRIALLEARLKMLESVNASLHEDKKRLEQDRDTTRRTLEADKTDLRSRLDSSEQDRRSMILLLEDFRKPQVPWWQFWSKAA